MMHKKVKDPFVALARKTVETFVKNGQIISPPDNLPSKMYTRRAGVFVSLHKKLSQPSPPPKSLKRPTQLHSAELYDGFEPPSPVEELRGCIGTYYPTQPNIAQEIIHNSIESASQDPRFPPIIVDELPSLTYSVDILSIPQVVVDTSCLNPKTYGLIVSRPDGRRGLLLPDLPGVETVDQQISICRQKAWISEDELITLYRFTVERHGEM